MLIDSIEDLSHRFNSDMQDSKTTFWTVLQTYDIEALRKYGIITSRHFDLLMDLQKRSEALNLTVYPEKKHSHHALTAFASEPEAFREVEALDKSYKEEISRISSREDS